MNLPSLVHLVWIVPLAMLAAYIGSPRFLGTMGSARVRRILDSGLEKNRYTVLHDFLLPAGGGTVHIEHLVVSRFGIWVIDSIHRAGWISGTDVQARWQQKSLWRSLRFDNPVHANFLKIQSLERLLQLPRSRFLPMIVFSGQRGFKSAVPASVLDVKKLISRIRSQHREVLNPDEADRAVLRLQESNLRQGLLGRAHRWKLARLVLLAVLMSVAYLVYEDPIRSLLTDLQRQADVRMMPESFHPDGSPKTTVERWEDSLNCVHSVDLLRCSCIEPGGAKVDLPESKCRELAERGSILKQ